MGRRPRASIAEAGVEALAADAVVHVSPAAHNRRPIVPDVFENTGESPVGGGVATSGAPARDRTARRRHPDDPGVRVTSQRLCRVTGG